MIKTEHSKPTFVDSNLPFLPHTRYINPNSTYKSEYSKKFLPYSVKELAQPYQPKHSEIFSTDPRNSFFWNQSLFQTDFGLKNSESEENAPVTIRTSSNQRKTNFKEHSDTFFEKNVQTSNKESYQSIPVTPREIFNFGTCNFDLKNIKQVSTASSTYKIDFNMFDDPIPARSCNWLKNTPSPIRKEDKIHQKETETASKYNPKIKDPNLETSYQMDSDVLGGPNLPWPETSYSFHYKSLPLNGKVFLKHEANIKLGDLGISNKEPDKSITKTDFVFHHSVDEEKKVVYNVKPQNVPFFNANFDINYQTSSYTDTYKPFDLTQVYEADVPQGYKRITHISDDTGKKTKPPMSSYAEDFPPKISGDRYPRIIYPCWELAPENGIKEDKPEENVEDYNLRPIILINKRGSNIKMFDENVKVNYQTTTKRDFKSPALESIICGETTNKFPTFSKDKVCISVN